jgi:hypothetical protein
MRYLAAIALFLSAAATAGAARLQNEGFESSDFTAWQCDGEGWRVSSYGRDSLRGVYGAVNDVWTNGSSEYRVVHQEIKASAGKMYRATVWLRAVCLEGAEGFLEVQFMDRGGSVIKQLQSPRVARDQEFRLLILDKMVAPEGTETVSIRGVAHLVTQPVKNTDYLVFDNFDFRQVTGSEPLPTR